jgi:hypothetical protein
VPNAPTFKRTQCSPFAHLAQRRLNKLFVFIGFGVRDGEAYRLELKVEDLNKLTFS